MKKSRRTLGWILTILASIAPAWGVIGKLTDEAMRSHMTDMGFGEWLPTIDFGEPIAVVLFILPKTGRIGILLISALMGGAITAHMGNEESFAMQATVLVIAWVAAFVRYPEFLKFTIS